MMKKIILQLYVLLVTMLIPVTMFANAEFGDDVSDVPIDGGISLLVAAGIGYGVNKIKANKKEK